MNVEAITLARTGVQGKALRGMEVVRNGSAVRR
jgi:hypothetical protein